MISAMVRHGSNTDPQQLPAFASTRDGPWRPRPKTPTHEVSLTVNQNTSRVSVVTVTFNNASGLAATLGSLAALRHPPFEVVVVDGGSTDETVRVVEGVGGALPLRFVSGPDDGIYDAMNKGQRLARGELVHYLNAGDTVFGEPYERVRGPCRLPVQVLDERGVLLFEDFVKHGGFGYCHQGLLFPRDHAPYRTELRIAADFDVIVATFPRGVLGLPKQADGGVAFGLGGVSTQRSEARDAEIRRVVRERLRGPRAWAILGLMVAKNAIPRDVRRRLVASTHHVRAWAAGCSLTRGRRTGPRA